MSEYEEKFSELVSAFDDDLKRKVHEQGLRVQQAARFLCPERRYGSGGGSLRQSIHVSTERRDDVVTSEIYTNSEYAPYVEFGTGPVGQENHNGINPDADPVYSQSGWVIPPDAMDPMDAEAYGFGVAKNKDGEVVGYYTRGQVAQPFMYPAINDLKESISKELADDLQKIVMKVVKK